MSRKTINGTLEDYQAFVRRLFCNRICWKEHKALNYKSATSSRIRAHKFIKSNCERCGIDKNLDVHHIDHNPLNNDLDNLKTLCDSCHTKTHWEEGKQSAGINYIGPCSICGLETRTHAGLCAKHYSRYKKYGNPFMKKKRNDKGEFVLISTIELFSTQAY
jgi:hypothetical protein